MAYSPLATPTATRAVLERHGIALKKSLGQNFLVNDAIIGKIVELADVQPEDIVLEVGPGIGTLTYALLERARAVVSIERDPALPPVLADTLGGFAGKFNLIEKDALDFTPDDLARLAPADLPCLTPADLSHLSSADLPCLRPADLPHTMPTDVTQPLLPNKFVANLPYAVAATVVLGYLQSMPSIQSATVMVQREVAERMMATPGSKNYGAYTVKLSMYAKPDGSFAVGPSNFMPPPHVDSTVLRLDRVQTGDLLADAGIERQAEIVDVEPACSVSFEGTKPLEDADRSNSACIESAIVRAACTMADAAFFARRKTIANSCRQYFSGRDKAVADMLPDIFAAAEVDPKTRGETLSIADYLRLGYALVCAV